MRARHLPWRFHPCVGGLPCSSGSSLIQRHNPPENVGGFEFPIAPAIDVGSTATAPFVRAPSPHRIGRATGVSV
jgi:hypothetical protein